MEQRSLQGNNYFTSRSVREFGAFMNSAVFCRIFPFVLFMGWIGIEEAVRFFSRQGFISISPQKILYLYPLKAISVGMALVYFRSSYDEIRLRDLATPSKSVASLVLGFLVFILWINMDWAFASQGTPQGFNPTIFADPLTRNAMIAVRLMGAAVVVPIMEELFWRSFLVRYIIDKEFTLVPIGLFTWPSFLITVAFFGLEHHYILAGIMAGIAYNALLYYTRSIAHCILSHAVTNLLLGIYVLQTGKWHFW
jgi:CAAX prenyl protease-like protein